MTDVAAGEGLEFHFEITREGTTLDAHPQLHLSRAHGLQDGSRSGSCAPTSARASSWATMPRSSASPSTPACPRTRCATCSPPTATPPRCARTSARRARSASARCRSSSWTAIGASGAQPPQVLADLLRRGWEQRQTVTVLAGGAMVRPGRLRRLTRVARFAPHVLGRARSPRVRDRSVAVRLSRRARGARGGLTRAM